MYSDKLCEIIADMFTDKENGSYYGFKAHEVRVDGKEPYIELKLNIGGKERIFIVDVEEL